MGRSSQAEAYPFRATPVCAAHLPLKTYTVAEACRIRDAAARPGPYRKPVERYTLRVRGARTLLSPFLVRFDRTTSSRSSGAPRTTVPRPIVRCIPLLLGFALTACGGPEATRREIPKASGSDTSDRATAALHPGVRTFVIVPAESKASYVADEELFALAFTKFGLPAGWAKVVGSTQAIEGRFQIDMEQPAASLGTNEFAVRMNTFSTGRDMRDNWIRENGPRFNNYPVATFRATAIEGAAGSGRPGEELSFNLRGTLTIREIARPATFAVRARLAGDTLDGDATTRLLMSSFGIETITFHDTLTVADEIGLDVHFRARAEREE
jgi:polyisoprenoid-binding protein YceI